ncbi:CGGC domain-containing protein [Methanocaldococcus indicus]|uniref:CGGC domain-containing protein n=1 Tax=Methanocaldococcus indicus TaxID=213231 RepID=UPI003C6D789C
MKVAIIGCKKMMEMGCGGKEACVSCFKNVNEKKGAFERYKDVKLIAFTNCGGCPGVRFKTRLNVLKDVVGAEAIHIASCSFNCPYLKFEEIAKEMMKELEIPIILGTHKIVKEVEGFVCSCKE